MKKNKKPGQMYIIIYIMNNSMQKEKVNWYKIDKVV